MVDHLEELRGRLSSAWSRWRSAFGVCLWQSHTLLHVINRPLTKQTQNQVQSGGGPARPDRVAQQAVLKVAGDTAALAASSSAPGAGCRPRCARSCAAQIPRLRSDVAKVPRTPAGQQAGDARHRRAVHDHDHRLLLLRAADGAADDPLRALRLRAAGADARRSGGSRDRCCGRCRCCSSRACSSATSSCCPRRCTSCRTSTAASSTCSCRRARYYKFAADHAARHGPVLRGAGGRARGRRARGS